MSEFFLVLTTVPDAETAERISKILVEDRLAACVSRSSLCLSSFRWMGKIEVEKEHILFIKTSRSRYPELEKKLTSVHPYDVPEIFAVPIKAGHKNYLDWVRKEVDPGNRDGSK